MLSKTVSDDVETKDQIQQNFQRWCDDSLGTVRRVDSDLISQLVAEGYIVSETMVRTTKDEPIDEDDSSLLDESGTPRKSIFGRSAGRRRPSRTVNCFEENRGNPPCMLQESFFQGNLRSVLVERRLQKIGLG